MCHILISFETIKYAFRFVFGDFKIYSIFTRVAPSFIFYQNMFRRHKWSYNNNKIVLKKILSSVRHIQHQIFVTQVIHPRKNQGRYPKFWTMWMSSLRAKIQSCAFRWGLPCSYIQYIRTGHVQNCLKSPNEQQTQLINVWIVYFIGFSLKHTQQSSISLS